MKDIKNLIEELNEKVNRLLSESMTLDMALSLIANDQNERIEIRKLASDTLTQDRF